MIKDAGLYGVVKKRPHSGSNITMFVDIWGKNISDRGKCKYKISDNGMCLVYSMNSKKTRVERKWWRTWTVLQNEFEMLHMC